MKELTAEEIAQWVIDHRYKSVFKQVTDAEMFIEIVDKITQKLQEKDKEIKYLEATNSVLNQDWKVMNSHIKEQAKEIERLKGENEKLASVISDVIRKHSIKDDIDFNY